MPGDARSSFGCSDYASPGEPFERFAYADLEVFIRDAVACNLCLIVDIWTAVTL